MAGQPSFTRAKRHHFFHTSVEITGEGSIELAPTTSLILHPTTDLVASPEGSYIVRTTASFVGDVSIGGDLYVGGSMIVTSSVLHKGDNIFGDEAGDEHKFIGTTTASGDLIVNTDVHVKTNASVDGTLAVAGNTDLTGSLLVDKNASVDGNLAVGGNITISGNEDLVGSLLVDKNASIDGTLAVGGNLTVSGNEDLVGSLLVDKNASIDGNLAVGGTTTITGLTTMNGSLLVDKNASIDGNVAVGGTTTITGLTTMNGSLLVDKNASIDGNLAVGGDTTITGSLTVNQSASIVGDLWVDGDIDFNDGILTGVMGGNTLHSRKITVTTSDLTAASTDQAVYLFMASAGDVIHNTVANVTAGFKYGGAATLIKMRIGDLADRNGFALDHLCGSSTSGWIMEEQTGMTDKGAYLWVASSNVPKTYTLATKIFAQFTSSGDTVYMASLDAGAVDVYVDVMQRQ